MREQVRRVLPDDLLVRAPGRRTFWRVMIWALGTAILGWACLITIAVLPTGTPARTIPSALMGLYIGVGCMSAFKRISAYRSGWVHGRAAMDRSLSEAARRGMTIGNWQRLERERTYAVLGIDPYAAEERRADEAVRDYPGKLGRVRAAWRRCGVRRTWRGLGWRRRGTGPGGPESVAGRDPAVGRQRDPADDRPDDSDAGQSPGQDGRRVDGS